MPETNELMKRPQDYDKIVLARTMELFMPKVISYLNDDWSENERSYIEGQMKDVLRESHHDGYEMARELENRHHWEPDRALVDLMDDGESCRREAYKEILKQWIEVYGITPERKIGDSVVADVYERRHLVGMISKFYLDEAKYGVRYPDQPETSCYLVEYERVKDVTDAAG